MSQKMRTFLQILELCSTTHSALKSEKSAILQCERLKYFQIFFYPCVFLYDFLFLKQVVIVKQFIPFVVALFFLFQSTVKPFLFSFFMIRNTSIQDDQVLYISKQLESIISILCGVMASTFTSQSWGPEFKPQLG